MVWRLFASVVWLTSWQLCHAGDLVNLASPVEKWYYRNEGVIFDGDRSTYSTLRRFGGSIELQYWQSEEPILATHYRITIPEHVPKTDYPRSWTVSGRLSYPDYDQYWDEVTGARFKNGVYEGPLGRKNEVARVRFIFRNLKWLTIADIELLGPRKALDALWPYGKYPCSRRLAPVPPSRLAKIFARPKPTEEGMLAQLFDPAKADWTTIYYDDFKPAILGAVLRKPALVREVMVNTHARKIVLQGSFCQPHCRKYGSKGWVKLAQVAPKKGYSHHKLSIENPEKYKGYRVKVYRKVNEAPKKTRYFQPSGIFFMQCLQ